MAKFCASEMMSFEQKFVTFFVLLRGLNTFQCRSIRLYSFERGDRGDLRGCIRGLRDEVEDAGDVESWSRKIIWQGALHGSARALCVFSGREIGDNCMEMKNIKVKKCFHLSLCS